MSSAALAWVIIFAILGGVSLVNTAFRSWRDVRVAKHTGQLPDVHREATEQECERQFWGRS